MPSNLVVNPSVRKAFSTIAASLAAVVGIFSFLGWDRPPFASQARAEQIAKEISTVTEQLAVTNYSILVLWENQVIEKKVRAEKSLQERPDDPLTIRAFQDADREMMTIGILKESSLKRVGSALSTLPIIPR